MIVVTESAAETERLGELLGGRLKGGETVLLAGELGAGKTCFVRGLARGLGIAPRAVKSPTYTVLHCHQGTRLRLCHFDAYFVREEEEFRRAGLDEFLAAGQVAAVEWADRYPAAFAPPAIEVSIAIEDEERRRISMAASGDEVSGLAEEVARAFQAEQTS